MPADTIARPWNAPTARKLAELRLRMARFQASSVGRLAMTSALANGSFSLFPHVTSARGVIEATDTAASVLCAEEHARLSESRVYAVDAATTRAAAAVASPPTARIDAARTPSPSGLMVFAEPIGSRPLGQPGNSIDVPIVAVSWSRWTADPVGRTRWLANTVHGNGPVPPGQAGIWLTFYAPSIFPGTPHLIWENESVLFLDATFPPLGSPLGTTGDWSQHVYTTWQMMAQTGRDAWTETEVVARGRSKGKRDRRAGITGELDVHMVRYRPPTPRNAAEGTSGGQRTAPDHRWEVQPYRSPNRCSAPTWHADGRCTHGERIIREHVNGPKGKPVRSGPVYAVSAALPDA